MKRPLFESFSARRCEHTFLDYPTIFDQLAIIEKVHAQIAREVESWRTPWHKWYAHIRTWLLREQRKDMHHLVQQLYEAVGKFKKNPSHILDHQEYFTQEMAFYGRETQQMKARAVKNRDELGNILIGLEAELKKGKTEEGDRERESVLREHLRSYVTKGHEFKVVQEYIQDLKREQYFADRKEEIALNSIYTAAGVMEKAEALEAQVDSIQVLYAAAIKKHNCFHALYSAVSRQREIIGDMERILTASQDRVMQVKYRDWNEQRSTFLEGLEVDEYGETEVTAPLIN